MSDQQLSIDNNEEKFAFGEKQEKKEYLTGQLITYIGNKRALKNIYFYWKNEVELEVKSRLN